MTFTPSSASDKVTRGWLRSSNFSKNFLQFFGEISYPPWGEAGARVSHCCLCCGPGDLESEKLETWKTGAP